MRKFLIIFLLSSIVFLYGQTSFLTYDYYTKSPVSNKVFHQIGKLWSMGKVSLYELSPIQNMTEGIDSTNDGSFVVYQKDDFTYTLFRSENFYLISDKLQGKSYYFKDFVPEYQWTLLNERKEMDGTTLRKAALNFRGREYIVWYDPMIKMENGPWKFSGLNYLIVEVYTADGQMRWKLRTKPALQKNNIYNPFKDIHETQFRSYTDYPSLAYGLSPALKEALSKNPNNTMFEQQRNQLETRFEWEK